MAIIPDAAPRIIAAKVTLVFIMVIPLAFGCSSGFSSVNFARRLCIVDIATHSQSKIGAIRLFSQEFFDDGQVKESDTVPE